MGVKDIAGNSKLMLETLKESVSDVAVVIRRVTQFRVTCKSKNLGLAFDANNKVDLIVKAVADGAVREHNKHNKTDLEVKAGDKVVQVNAQTGSGDHLSKLIQSADHDLELLIHRPST